LDRDDLPAQKRTRYVQLVRGGLERIQGTVAGLLRFTPRSAERAAVDLAGPVSDAIALMQHSASKSGVEISFDDRSGNARVLGSASELGQAVLNLISNALHAIQDRQRSSGDTEGGGHIEVGLLSERGELRLSVMDDGIGVPEEELERMTDLFYTTKEVGRGTGLGLALVLSVVNQHTGHVHLANREGGGFRVEIVLPLAADGESQA
jgi:signal transduction histidine kinase